MSKKETNGTDGGSVIAFLFEAKGIQRYIFDFGLLRDLVGASDLVAGLAHTKIEDSENNAGRATPTTADQPSDDLIGRVLAAMQLEAAPVFSRRASGSFCLHGEDAEALGRVRALWRLAMMLRCPGLEFSEGWGVADATAIATKDTDVDAMQVAYRSGSLFRENSVSELAPPGHPLTEFAGHTGRPATTNKSYKDDDIQLDALGEPQRVRADALQGKSDGVSRRFLGSLTWDEEGREIRFPRNLEPNEQDTFENPLFPFRDEDDTQIAIVHADLSGLGQIFTKTASLTGSAVEVLRLAKTIERAIESAVQSTTATVLVPHAKPWKDGFAATIVPARPVVLGGDDITVLVRADLALAFAEMLLAEIEQSSGEALAGLAHSSGMALPEALSACAGIAVVKRGQPFVMANSIAEDLCRCAKESAKAFKIDPLDAGEAMRPYPSAFAFHVVGTTLQEHYDDILRNELTIPWDGGSTMRLTGNPYWVGASSSAQAGPTYQGLRKLAQTLADIPGGNGLRQLRSQVFSDRGAAFSRWRRWWKIAKARHSSSAKEIEIALADLGLRQADAREDAHPPLVDRFRAATPLFDALDLIDIGAVTATGKHNDSGETR